MSKQIIQIQQLFSTAKISHITGVILAAILAYMQRGVIDFVVIISWFMLILLVAFFRIALVNAYQQSVDIDETIAHSWLLRFRLGVLVSGLIWGSTSFLLFPANHPEQQIFLIFMLAGVTAGGSVSYSADLVSAITNNVTIIIPLIIRLFVSEESLSTAMGGAVTLYLGFMIVSLRYINKNICENIELRFEAISREAAIRASEQQYRLLLNHSPVGILHYDSSNLLPRQQLQLQQQLLQQQLLKAIQPATTSCLLVLVGRKASPNSPISLFLSTMSSGSLRFKF